MATSQVYGETQPTSPSPEVWGKVPPRNKNFTGREDVLQALRAGVSAEVTAVVPRPHALHGLGGVGKTQVAIEYAYRYAGDYDLVWWIPADQPVLVRSALAALAPHLGVGGTGIEDAASAVLDALRRGQPYRRWLLIFDNADQPEDINDLIPRGPGHVLITSRNHRWEGVVDTVEVDVFSREESVEFLNRRVPKGVDRAEADRLAKALGDLPLALEQAGALQAETGMSVDEYLRLLAERTGQLLGEGKPTEYPLSMTAAWRLSVDQLEARMPEAVELLRCCAFFGPEPIPRDIFRRGGQVSGARLRRIVSNPILLARAIRELGRFALARIDISARTIQIHRLVQMLLRDDVPPDQQEQMRHEVHLLLATGGPSDPEDSRDWPQYEELVAHVRPAGVAKCSAPEVRQFALDVVRYLYVTGDFKSSEDFARSFREQWTRDSAPDSPEVLTVRRHLGNAIREVGRYREAYELDRETLERVRTALGPEHIETLRITNSFGADLRARGEFHEARNLDEESRRLHERVLGENHVWTIRTKNNLALDLALIGRYREARALHEEAYLQISAPEVQGASKGDVVSMWNSLARDVRLCGDYKEACDLGEDAHAYGVRELGPEHYWTLRAAKDLSIAYRRAGRYDEALTLAREVLAKFERIYGKEHPDTMAAVVNLSNILRTTGNVDEAFALSTETLQHYPSIYGPDHPYTYGCAMNLALLHRLRGDLELARETGRKALHGLEARLGRMHDYTLTCAVNLASDHAVSGDHRTARELGEDALPRLRELLGEDHPMTLACAANLSVDLRALGLEEEATRLFEDTMARYHATLGPDHADTQVAMVGRRLDCDFDPPPI